MSDNTLAAVVIAAVMVVLAAIGLVWLIVSIAKTAGAC